MIQDFFSLKIIIPFFIGIIIFLILLFVAGILLLMKNIEWMNTVLLISFVLTIFYFAITAGFFLAHWCFYHTTKKEYTLFAIILSGALIIFGLTTYLVFGYSSN